MKITFEESAATYPEMRRRAETIACTFFDCNSDQLRFDEETAAPLAVTLRGEVTVWRGQFTVHQVDPEPF